MMKNQIPLLPGLIGFDVGKPLENFKWEIKIDFGDDGGKQIRADFPTKDDAIRAALEIAARGDCTYIEIARRYA